MFTFADCKYDVKTKECPLRLRLYPDNLMQLVLP